MSEYVALFTIEFWAQGSTILEGATEPVNKGYKIGTKLCRSLDTFTATINKAFGKTLPGGDTLVAKVSFETKHRGTNSVTLTADNYEDGLEAIESAIDADMITLDTLLE